MIHRTAINTILLILCTLFFILNCSLYFPPASFNGPVEEPTTAPTPWPAPTLIPTPTIPPDGNLLYNYDFSNGLDSWTFWVHTTLGANASVEALNEEAVITIINGGTEGWHVQFQQKYLNIVRQKNYRLTFDARATAVRTVYLEVGEDGYDNNGDGNSYTSYGGLTINILSTGTMAGYEWNFTMNHKTDPLARLVFNCGQNSLDLWIDNVILEEVP